MDRPRLVLLSLEPWDTVWRRNQHVAVELVRQGEVSRVLFVEPPGSPALEPYEVAPGVEAVRPPLPVLPRFGGIVLAAAWLRTRLDAHDVIWINNAPLGRWFARGSRCYDVTDDWRETRQGMATRRRLVRAEDILARSATTIVCSEVLRSRWRERYGVDATLIPNGVDLASVRAAEARALDGPKPHYSYVGSLHDERLDVALLTELAAKTPGTIHLVGPNYLSASTQSTLSRHTNIDLHGPVASEEVGGWLVSSTVLLLPHLVTPFTLSLDAIKAHEYLATDRPIVATATSGFQGAASPGLRVVEPRDFVRAAVEAADDSPSTRQIPLGWDARARQFAEALGLRQTE